MLKLWCVAVSALWRRERMEGAAAEEETAGAPRLGFARQMRDAGLRRMGGGFG